MEFFDVLYDCSEDWHALSPGLREGYGGDLGFPEPPPERPYVFSNFVGSLDGMATFGGQGASEARLISGRSRDDHWLMGLLRGACDAVIVGAGTLRADTRHTWTARDLKGADSDAIEDWRKASGRPSHPLQCFVTASGDIDSDCSVFECQDLESVVFTTSSGKRALSFRRDQRVTVSVHDGRAGVDLSSALRFLRSEMGVKVLLCEGGPGLFGEMTDLRLVDEMFQTLSPVLVGSDRMVEGRLGLTDGAIWSPDTAPRFQLVSVRSGLRDRNHLFLRYRKA